MSTIKIVLKSIICIKGLQVWSLIFIFYKLNITIHNSRIKIHVVLQKCIQKNRNTSLKCKYHNIVLGCSTWVNELIYVWTMHAYVNTVQHPSTLSPIIYNPPVWASIPGHRGGTWHWVASSQYHSWLCTDEQQSNSWWQLMNFCKHAFLWETVLRV